MESNEIITLRYMAWERAKGELQSLLHTYWDDNYIHLEKVEKLIEKFIGDFEDTFI